MGVTAGREGEGEGRAGQAAPHLLHVSVLVLDDPADPLPGLEPVPGHCLLEPPGPGLDSGPTSGLDLVHEDCPAALGRGLGLGPGLWTFS